MKLLRKEILTICYNKLLMLSIINMLILSCTCDIFADPYPGSGFICTASELIEELEQDLNDNNRLDCLLESVQGTNEDLEQDEDNNSSPYSSFLEFSNLSKYKQDVLSNNKKKLHLWKSNCSFKTSPHNFTTFYRNYPLTSGLLDIDGNPINAPSPLEATLCVIVRSLLGNNLIPEYTSNVDLLINVPKGVVEKYLRCPGIGENSVCAATASYFLDEDAWVMFIDPQTIAIDGHPKFKSMDNKD